METKSTFCRNRQAKSHYIKPALNILLTNAKLKIINRRKKGNYVQNKNVVKKKPYPWIGCLGACRRIPGCQWSTGKATLH